MAGKPKKKPNLRFQILNLIVNKGPVRLKDMTKALGASYQSLNTEALELRRLGVIQKDDGIWSQVPGADLSQFGIVATSGKAGSSARVAKPAIAPRSEDPPSFRDQFEDLLRRAGIAKGIASTIADIYFNSADLWDAQRLYKVLMVYAAGYVSEGQARLIMSYWSMKNGFPCELEDFFDIEDI